MAAGTARLAAARHLALPESAFVVREQIQSHDIELHFLPPFIHFIVVHQLLGMSYPARLVAGVVAAGWARSETLLLPREQVQNSNIEFHFLAPLARFA